MKVTLNRNGWHRRLQGYVLNVRPWQVPTNLCPYFWLTIFCLLVVPFVAGWRTVGKALILFGSTLEVIGNAIAAPIDRFICGPLDHYYVENYIKTLPSETIVKYSTTSNTKKWKIFWRWREAMVAEKKDPAVELEKLRAEINARWEATRAEREAAERAAYEKEMKERAEKRRRRLTREQQLMKLAAMTQKIFPFLALAVLTPILYGLYRLGYWLVTLIQRAAIPWDKVLHYTLIGLEALGLALLIIGAVAGIILILSVFFKRLWTKCWITAAVPFRTPAARKFGRVIGKVLVTILGPIAIVIWGIVAGLTEGCSLFVQYIKAAKGNYCPGIEWKE